MPALRDFIATLEERGKLKRIRREVDWRYEIGAISRGSKIPLLFEAIRNYPNGRLFTNGLIDYSSFSLALGIDKGRVRFNELVSAVRRGFANPIEPVLVEQPEFLDNRISRDINLEALPIPLWSDKDAGRYVGTWHLNVSRDPETGFRNVGIYRMQMIAPDKTTVSVSPRSHLAFHISRAEQKKVPLPMAVAIGVDERLVIAAAAAPAYGIDEIASAGGLSGRPVGLVRCATQPLEVPADAEIVIEGFIEPGVRIQDGPFLDYAGIANTNPLAYLFQATGLFFKNDLIFRGTAVGPPGAEDHQLYAVLSRAGLADFHGSRVRHSLQTFLLRHRAFTLFQLTGRVGTLARTGSKKHPKEGT